jgi:uncharacterized protein
LAVSVFAAVSVLGVAVPAQAAPAYPHAHGRCVDQTEVLGAGLCAEVTAILLRDEKSTSDEIAVALVPTTGEVSINAWTTGLFNAWRVGKKGKNNGVLLVVALDDHKVRLETGRGVQSRLSDREAAKIVHDVTSHFADDEDALGILTGLDDVRRQLGHRIVAGALLAPLANEVTMQADPDFTDSDDPGISADGPDFFTDATEPGGEGSFPLVPVAIGALVVAGLFAVIVRRASSTGGPGALSTTDRDRQNLAASTLMSHSTGSSFTSPSSGADSSSAAGPSFGGGSSDGGGGATGSW